MASTITNYSNLIDVNYPTPGVDNDTQGFRNNFANIKSALNVSGDEITSLQLNLVSLDDSNDFGGNQIKNATITGSSIILKSYSLADLGALTSGEAVENGTLVFINEIYNCPAYYNNGTWYALTGTSVVLS